MATDDSVKVAIQARENKMSYFPDGNFFSLGSFVFEQLEDLAVNLIEHCDPCFAHVKLRLHINTEPTGLLLLSYQPPRRLIGKPNFPGCFYLQANVQTMLILSVTKMDVLTSRLPRFQIMSGKTKAAIANLGHASASNSATPADDHMFVAEHRIGTIPGLVDFSRVRLG